MDHGGTRLIIYAALTANLLIALAKFAAAIFTRSSAMLAEGFHSVADTVNQIFLLVGVKLSAKPPDAKHHFGHAHEQYFWAFIVAITIFTVGASFSIYEGVHKLLHYREPEQALQHPWWGLGVLVISIVLEGISWVLACRAFIRHKGERSLAQTFSDARDPVILTVLFEDSAALIGLIAALCGLCLAWATGNMIYDGLASIFVGVILVSVAYILARETKDLLLGECMVPMDTERMKAKVLSHPRVQRLITQRTMHLGPEEVLAVLKIEFSDSLSTDQIEQTINEIESELRAELPYLKRIWIEPGMGQPPFQSTDP